VGRRGGGVCGSGSGAKCTVFCCVGVSTTLRDGPAEGKSDVLRGSGASQMGGDTGTGAAGVCRSVRRLVSWFRVATWLSVSGARGEPGDGCWIACRIS
jgi:hypothetical protein